MGKALEVVDSFVPPRNIKFSSKLCRAAVTPLRVRLLVGPLAAPLHMRQLNHEDLSIALETIELQTAAVMPMRVLLNALPSPLHMQTA